MHICLERRSIAALLSALVGLSIFPDTSVAELILHVGDVTTVEGQTGFVDVFFEVTSGTPRLAGYQIELELSGPTSNVQLQELGEAARAVFPGQVAETTTGRPSLPGFTAAANDFIFPSADNPLGENLIEDGAGMVRVLFATDLGSAGVYNVIIDRDPLHTNLSDGLASPIPIDGFADGTITVVPEPSSRSLLVGIGLAIVTVCRQRPVERPLAI